MIDIGITHEDGSLYSGRLASSGLLVAMSSGVAAATLRWDDCMHGDDDLARFVRLADSSGCDSLLLIAVAPLAIRMPGCGVSSVREVIAIDTISRDGERTNILRQVLRDGDRGVLAFAALRGHAGFEFRLVSILDCVWPPTDGEVAHARPPSPLLN